MITWLDTLPRLAAAATPAVLVTVAIVEGSGPREPGAKMLVTADTQFDTIGGGHLELRACEAARAMLAQPQALHRLERFPLGPGLGQCCGGVVHLAFECIDAGAYAPYLQLVTHWQARRDAWRRVALDTALPPLVSAESHAAANAVDTLPAPEPEQDTPDTRVVRDSTGQAWLIDCCRAWRPHLVLFGAGHVGAAIVRALAPLPCRVTWVDERDDVFPSDVPANVTVEASDTPEAVVANAPPGTSFLVMTHSHALDQRLAEAILKREDRGWFGLIGSRTKRVQFERRLGARGISPQRLADMVCPIGVPGITGKEPAVIAASVCAQLLQVWARAAQAARPSAASRKPRLHVA